MERLIATGDDSEHFTSRREDFWKILPVESFQLLAVQKIALLCDQINRSTLAQLR